MPIECPISFPRLTESQMRELDYKVMGQVFSEHSELGRLCDEKVYESVLRDRLTEMGMPAATNVPVVVSFDQFSKTYRLDCVVDGRVIYELKTVSKLTLACEAQLLNYLLLTNSTRGKLVNFRPSSVESRFVNTTLDFPTRRQFKLCQDVGLAEDRCTERVKAIVSDWGTGLSGELYREAILHGFGGMEKCDQQLPMRCRGRVVGNQRFYVIEGFCAVYVTTFNQLDFNSYLNHLKKLQSHSPIDRGIWINVGLHDLSIRMIV